MFNTYVINLDKDKKRLNNIKKNLLNNNINLLRFKAIDGNNLNVKYNNHISKICKLTCPKSVVGCGLSHIYLSEYLLKNDKNDYALVLEDDIYTYEKDLKNTINKIAREAPKDWEIILLHCQGVCKNYKKYEKNKYERTFSHGSFASYLISKKGQEKLSKIKLTNHIDVQVLMFSKIKSYSFNKKIFYTDESDSHNRENHKYKLSLINYYDNIYKNKKIKYMTHEPSFFLNYKLLRVPYINKEFTVFFVIGFIFLILIYSLIKFNFKNDKILALIFFLIFIFPIIFI